MERKKVFLSFPFHHDLDFFLFFFAYHFSQVFLLCFHSFIKVMNDDDDSFSRKSRSKSIDFFYSFFAFRDWICQPVKFVCDISLLLLNSWMLLLAINYQLEYGCDTRVSGQSNGWLTIQKVFKNNMDNGDHHYQGQRNVSCAKGIRPQNELIQEFFFLWKNQFF